MNPKYLFYLKGKSTNLLCPYTLTDAGTNLVESDYCDVEGNATYSLRNSSGNTLTIRGYKFYTKNKKYISGGDTTATTIPAPSNARYVKVKFSPLTDNNNIGLFKETFESFERWDTGRVNPMYKELTIDYEKESNQMFFRRKINGKLKFIRKDYDYLMTKDIWYEFQLQIFKEETNWVKYWEGKFFYTDCEFDADNKIISVTPQVVDEYSFILDNYEQELDLIQLAPPITQCRYDKRPIMQIYGAGASSIACLQRGEWWEQDAVPEDDDTKLQDNMGFERLKNYRIITLSGATGTFLPINNVYMGTFEDNAQHTDFGYFGKTKENENNGYILSLNIEQIQGSQPIAYNFNYILTNVQTAAVVASYQAQAVSIFYEPETITLTGTAGSITANFKILKIYGRFLSDVPSFYYGGGTSTGVELNSDDVAYTKNYKYAYRTYVANFKNYVNVYRWFVEEPTEWGKYDDWYYKQPQNTDIPVSRSLWAETAIWFNKDAWTLEVPTTVEGLMSKENTLRDSYRLADAINAVLKQISGYTFGVTRANSEYLFYNKTIYNPSNPIPACLVDLFITPKSNILNSGYDIPAQKAPVTLKLLMDALKNMFECYWFIDNGKFRIEQIYFFRNGGNYDGSTTIGRDLTEEIVPRNGKHWSFGQNKYYFDKPDMISQFTFGWDDDVSRTFNGYPIISDTDWDNKGTTEEISVGQITTDIDFMLTNPESCSLDGYAMLGCESGKVKYYTDGNVKIQNYYLSFEYLQRHDYYWQMPAARYRINGVLFEPYPAKLKMQDVSFPALVDPDILKLVKTGIGSGQIQKLSINLASRNAKATLCYDTTE